VGFGLRGGGWTEARGSSGKRPVDVLRKKRAHVRATNAGPVGLHVRARARCPCPLSLLLVAYAVEDVDLAGIGLVYQIGQHGTDGVVGAAVAVNVAQANHTA